MSLIHHRIITLPSAAVFEALRNLGGIVRKKIDKLQRDAGSPRPISLLGAPPSEDVARLLLHVALEDKGLLLNSLLNFYLFAHGSILHNMRGAPNTTGWDVSATDIMTFMQNRIQIFYENGQWEIICSTEIRHVKEIRELIKKIQPEAPRVVWKNVVIGSTIQVGGNMTFGDTTYVSQIGATLHQKQAFVEATTHLLQNGHLFQAITTTLAFSKDAYPDLYTSVLALLGYLYKWNEERKNGTMVETEANTGWQGMNQAMFGILTTFLEQKES